MVIAVSEVRRQATVHNLTVADLHTYFVVVGDAPTLVHNTSCPVNLASPSRTQHILDGDPRPGGGLAGGHRAGTGAGKSEFPAAWSDDMIMHNISDVATDPTLNWVQQTGRLGSEFTRNGDPVRFAVDGMRGGVMIRVVIEPRGVGIVTAFPIG
ncbi:MAG: EndoU domain-containing protein [Microcella sp.]|nr:MAG: EndoU domain-containing protein [Microcella sp.]